MGRLLIVLCVLYVNGFCVPGWVWAISFVMTGFSFLAVVASLLDKRK